MHTHLSYFEKFLPTRILEPKRLSNFQIISHQHCYLDSTLIRHHRVTNALSFYRSQNVLCQSKFFEPAKKIWMHLVPLQKLLCWHKNQFYWMQIIFLSGTKCLWLPQYVNKFLVWHKKFGPAQIITCKRTRHRNGFSG